MSYKYTFKQYIKDKIKELHPPLDTAIIFVIWFFGSLVINIILYKRFKGSRFLFPYIIYAELVWSAVCAILYLPISFVITDFKIKKRKHEAQELLRKKDANTK